METSQNNVLTINIIVQTQNQYKQGRANKSFKKYDNLIRSDNKHCCTDKNRQNE